MGADRPGLELLGEQPGDVHVRGDEDAATTWQLVRALDERGLRAIAAPAGADDEAASGVMAGCGAMAAVLPAGEHEPGGAGASVLRDLSRALGLGLAVAVLCEPGAEVELAGTTLRAGAAGPIDLPGGAAVRVFADPQPAARWLDDACRRTRGEREPRPPSAFFIGRLERDFAQAREAVRVAVEREAAIACLWSDDGRHRMDVASVRERTRVLIRDACFVVADLTLGPESPDQENPSRAHEIGMALAYERHVMLCSQEPRRYPYFSIGDMQMFFWAVEPELAAGVERWIRTTPGVFTRRILNRELAARDHAGSPRIAMPELRFDPAQRFVGPAARRRRSARRRGRAS